MKSIRVKFLKPVLLVVLAVLPVIVACGSTRDGDAGMSLTALSWIQCDDLNKYLKGEADCVLSEKELINEIEAYLYNDSIYGQLLHAIGIRVQNNLSGQTIRTRRARLEYYIPGASVQPPVAYASVGYTLGSPDCDTTDGVSTTLPDSLCGRNNAYTFGLDPITDTTEKFILDNMNAMPARPFTMVVTVYVEGLSSSGDTYESNPLDLDIFFNDAGNYDPVRTVTVTATPNSTEEDY